MDERKGINTRIKEMNSLRATYVKDFSSLEERYRRGELAEKRYQKAKLKHEARLEKLKKRIRDLEARD